MPTQISLHTQTLNGWLRSAKPLCKVFQSTHILKCHKRNRITPSVSTFIHICLLAENNTPWGALLLCAPSNYLAHMRLTWSGLVWSPPGNTSRVTTHKRIHLMPSPLLLPCLLRTIPLRISSFNLCSMHGQIKVYSTALFK